MGCDTLSTELIQLQYFKMNSLNISNAITTINSLDIICESYHIDTSHYVVHEHYHNVYFTLMLNIDMVSCQHDVKLLWRDIC